MIIYETDGKWTVETDGGHRNRDDIHPEQRTCDARPQPVARWSTGWVPAHYQGEEKRDYTRFVTGDETFTVVRYSFSNDQGYSWSEGWERLCDGNPEPPALGAAYRWTGNGWEPIPHPQAV